MSTVAYVQRQRRGLREAAARERRKKFLALGLMGLLAVVLVIQVPRTLDMMSSDSAGVTSTAAPATPSAASAPAAAEAPQTLPRALRSARLRDAFVGQRIADGETRPAAVGAPAGLRDPFQARSAPAPTPAPAPVARPSLPQRIVVGTPSASRPRWVGYTVVLASIPTRSGRAQAVRFARTARARGVSGVGVLQSSTRNRLRPGYWVVYSGQFRSAAGAQRAAARVHAQGYRTAYLRQLVRY
jgi:hypothetical protein